LARAWWWVWLLWNNTVINMEPIAGWLAPPRRNAHTTASEVDEGPSSQSHWARHLAVGAVGSVAPSGALPTRALMPLRRGDPEDVENLAGGLSADSSTAFGMGLTACRAGRGRGQHLCLGVSKVVDRVTR